MAKSKQNPGYAGRISNGGSQKVTAIYQQPAVKGGKVQKGGDLRHKGNQRDSQG